ncbi:DUF1499 domain-containing protein [Aidingimonas halophila]|uniref:Uncharacterized conserved protein, DUF1499 family n=1 Tax=Aidingimonas halophila TaxID=574349 RepID=A0A1H2ZVI8_9GAMM|nr:DUF1499 domain-containing protein [Aidingimonas halophila]GHC16775.1 hypothetical protein GCM10008094_02650 [Aidingimonas halophila]SDX21317.1 Uncharacterized conserved protein, DUF1499 family [Aidingimonas halophila]
MATRQRGGRFPLIMGTLAVVLLVLAALLMGMAGPAYRMEWVALGDAFEMLRRGAYFAIGAGIVAIIALLVAVICRRARPAVASGLVIIACLGLLAVPWLHWQRAQDAPPIHDITTDTENPPAFDAVAEAREAAPNAVDYPGEETAQQQLEAYPDIGPIVLNASLDNVREAAEAEMRDRGWSLAQAGDDTLEATATTTWFGFEDDVVIRLTDNDGQVRVDMRSASRLGRGDAGTNAARIRDYLTALEARLE